MDRKLGLIMFLIIRIVFNYTSKHMEWFIWKDHQISYHYMECIEQCIYFLKCTCTYRYAYRWFPVSLIGASPKLGSLHSCNTNSYNLSFLIPCRSFTVKSAISACYEREALKKNRTNDKLSRLFATNEETVD